LHALDCDGHGFRWVEADDAARSVFAFLRLGPQPGQVVLVVWNGTPLPHDGYRLGVPIEGAWREVLNGDADVYGGSGMGNPEPVHAQPIGSQGHASSIVMTVPPLACTFWVPEGSA
jgi:1,4-alpha-glucan branching enzyme